MKNHQLDQWKNSLKQKPKCLFIMGSFVCVNDVSITIIIIICGTYDIV